MADNDDADLSLEKTFDIHTYEERKIKQGQNNQNVIFLEKIICVYW